MTLDFMARLAARVLQLRALPGLAHGAGMGTERDTVLNGSRLQPVQAGSPLELQRRVWLIRDQQPTALQQPNDAPTQAVQQLHQVIARRPPGDDFLEQSGREIKLTQERRATAYVCRFFAFGKTAILVDDQASQVLFKSGVLTGDNIPGTAGICSDAVVNVFRSNHIGDFDFDIQEDGCTP